MTDDAKGPYQLTKATKYKEGDKIELGNGDVVILDAQGAKIANIIYTEGLEAGMSSPWRNADIRFTGELGK